MCFLLGTNEWIWLLPVSLCLFTWELTLLISKVVIEMGILIVVIILLTCSVVFLVVFLCFNNYALYFFLQSFCYAHSYFQPQILPLVFLRVRWLDINMFWLFISWKVFLSSSVMTYSFAGYMSLGWASQSFRSWSAFCCVLKVFKVSKFSWRNKLDFPIFFTCIFLTEFLIYFLFMYIDLTIVYQGDFCLLFFLYCSVYFLHLWVCVSLVCRFPL